MILAKGHKICCQGDFSYLNTIFERAVHKLNVSTSPAAGISADSRHYGVFPAPNCAGDTASNANSKHEAFFI